MREADQHSQQLVSDANKDAEQFIAQASAQADQLLTDTEERDQAASSRSPKRARRADQAEGERLQFLAQIRQLLNT